MERRGMRLSVWKTMVKRREREACSGVVGGQERSRGGGWRVGEKGSARGHELWRGRDCGEKEVSLMSFVEGERRRGREGVRGRAWEARALVAVMRPRGEMALRGTPQALLWRLIRGRHARTHANAGTRTHLCLPLSLWSCLSFRYSKDTRDAP